MHFSLRAWPTTTDASAAGSEKWDACHVRAQVEGGGWDFSKCVENVVKGREASGISLPVSFYVRMCDTFCMCVSFFSQLLFCPF